MEGISTCPYGCVHPMCSHIHVHTWKPKTIIRGLHPLLPTSYFEQLLLQSPELLSSAGVAGQWTPGRFPPHLLRLKTCISSQETLNPVDIAEVSMGVREKRSQALSHSCSVAGLQVSALITTAQKPNKKAASKPNITAPPELGFTVLPPGSKLESNFIPLLLLCIFIASANYEFRGNPRLLDAQ